MVVKNNNYGKDSHHSLTFLIIFFAKSVFHGVDQNQGLRIKNINHLSLIKKIEEVVVQVVLQGEVVLQEDEKKLPESD